MQGIDNCMRAISSAVKYGQCRISLLARLPPQVNAQKLLKGPLKKIDEATAKALLSSVGLTVPPSSMISIDEARTGRIGDIDIAFPVVDKICSPDITHKTELGAVKLNIQSKSELVAAVATIYSSVQITAPNACLKGFLIETMISKPIAELMVSIRRDEKMGLIMTFASGGILTELLQDSATLIVPALDSQINKAIDSLRIALLLNGFRGGATASRTPLISNIQALIYLMQTNQNLIEVEINPLMVGSDWTVCADAVVSKIQSG